MSSESEIEYTKVKTVNQELENLPGKLLKKLKRKREKVSSSSESEENERSKAIKNLQRNSTVKDSVKLKKQENKKVHAVGSPSLSNRQVEASDSASNGSEYKHIGMHNIKQEVVSENAETNSDSDHNVASVSKKTKLGAVKHEVSDNSNSDFEEDDKISRTPKHQRKHSILESSSVNILQDIRLTPKSPTEKLKEMYPGLKPFQIPTELNFSDSDEIHLFRIPKNLDPKLLKNAEIDLEHEFKINLGEKYLITPTIKIPDPTLVISTNSRVLQFKNNIKIEKYIKSKTEPNIKIPERTSVPLPENLKKRHPLFGSDFQQKIKLSEHVERKLDEAIADFLKRERKSKKKKDKKKKREDKDDEPNQEIFSLLNSHSYLINHDRIKKEASDDSAFGSSSSVDRPRSKKREKERDHPSDQNNEQNADLSVERGERSKVSVERAERSKIKKKDRKSNDYDLLHASTIKNEIQDIDYIKTEEEIHTSPKKEKRNSTIVNSTLMSDILKTPTFNTDVSSVVSEASSSMKKSKKDKKSKNETSVKKEKLISELLNDVTRKINTSSKKIKMEF